MEAVDAVQCSLSTGPRAADQAARLARAAAAMALAALLLAPGCVREAAKEAASGTLEALDRGARGLVAPAGGSGEGAAGGSGEGAAGGSGEGAAGGSGEGAAGGAPQRGRPLVGALVHDAVRAGAAEIGRQAGTLEPIIAQTSEAVSSAVVQGALQHDQALVTLVEQGSGAAARAVAREGTAQLVEQLAGCPAGDPGCSGAAIERASRAAASGFADGLGRAIKPWIVGLAFGGGFLLAALIAVAIAAVSRRHERSATHG
ncbi:hypothetical protein [Sorangium sp. So ce1151]|uniref:hypothetical protein n=1 Tax=Sorangium sp. So ce1151 TaxID=3133332 RepID=UPI003F6067D0